MLPSVAQLTKILKNEGDHDYSNRAVIGGLPKLLAFWEPLAVRDGLPADLIRAVAERVRAYPDLPLDKRPAAIGELQALIERGAAGEKTPPPPPASPPAGRASAPAAAPRPAPAPASRPSGPSATDSPRGKRPPREAARPGAPYATLEPLEARPRRTLPPRPLVSAKPLDPEAGLDASLRVLHGVGPQRASQFEKIGVRTLRDLLLYFPRRYDDYSTMKTINRLEMGEECTLVASVLEARQHRIRGGQAVRLAVVLSDSTGTIEVSFFNQPWLAPKLRPGKQIVISGRVDQYLGRLTLKPDEWEDLDRELLNTGRIVPRYRLTAELKNRSVRQVTAQVIKFWADRMPDILPADMRERSGLIKYDEALRQIHFPDSQPRLEAARQRLAFDELLCLQIGVLRQRRQWQTADGRPCVASQEWLDAFLAGLPYAPTSAQSRAIADVRADLGRAVPMNRLLQGDVGSGKTLVAASAIALTVQAGGQAALMAPTSILAEQHYTTILDLLAGADGSGRLPAAAIRLLQGATSAAEKEEIYAGLRSGEIKVVVGTHALIEAPVEFADLGLAVVDEQHRFGVAQRAALRAKGGAHTPHLLVMTATPIPRTLALTVYGDLDLSVIDEMPPGRQAITTYVLHAHERGRAFDFIRREIEKGRQAFIIFPLVEESAKVEARAAVEEHARLQKEEFPDLALGLLHGRLKPDEKDETMARFKAGEYQALVSTSVVEVGVDVPNASVMLVEGANRFGLSQLHQFRGRVGRGEHASYCLLVSDSPNPRSDERLAAMEATQDGFVLAEKDLELRGPGDFLGTRQSGFGAESLAVARLTDMRTIEKARREAEHLMEVDPDLQQADHTMIAERVAQFWSARDGAGDVS